MGCYAFALEECGDYDRAEREGRAALAIEPQDPWGAHAVAHVLHSVGRPRQGLAWLDEIEGCLAGANNFAGHVHWHRALFLCALGRHEEALALHDARVAIYPARDYRDLVNSATLLYRLERAGLDLAHRWEELVAVAIPRADDHLLAFADVHYVLVLASAGEHERAASMVASMRARAAEAAGSEASTLLEVGVPVAEAIACAHRDPARTVELLVRHEADLSRLGGSRAQREIFSAVLADAASRIEASLRARAPGMLAA
jgi:tetratricopeptide (TPR) repeat protein